MIEIYYLCSTVACTDVSERPPPIPDMNWLDPGYVGGHGADEKNKEGQQNQGGGNGGGGSPTTTDPKPDAESDVNPNPLGLPSGALLGTCPADVEGQSYSLYVENASARGLGDNLPAEDTGQRAGGYYVAYCMPEGGELGGGEPIVISVSVEEFRRLPLAGSGIVIEPDRDDYIIRLPVIGLTDPSAQVLTTTIVGINVAVRATPVEYSWDFGDGSQPLVTTDPGRSYPDQTVEHLYTELGDFTINLTTTWEGEFSIDGGATWLPINGTTTTTDTAAPIRVEERVPLLVNGDNT